MLTNAAQEFCAEVKPWFLNRKTTLPRYRARQGLQREAQLIDWQKIAGERSCLSFAGFRTTIWQAACQNVTYKDDTHTTAHSNQGGLHCKTPRAAGRYICVLLFCFPPPTLLPLPIPARLLSIAEPGRQRGRGWTMPGRAGRRTVQLLAHSQAAWLQHELALQLLGQLLRQEGPLKLPGAGTVLWSMGHSITNVAHLNSKGIFMSCSKINHNNLCWIDWRLAKLHLPWSKSRFCMLACSALSVITELTLFCIFTLA